MNQIPSILEDTYQLAASSDSTYTALSKSQERWVNTIIEKAESFRAVLTVLITSLVKKIQTPTQVKYPSTFSTKLLEKSSVRFSTESRNQRTTFAVLEKLAKSIILKQSAIGV